MRIIARKALGEFWESHADAEGALKSWYHEVKVADWQTPQEIRERYGSADFLPDNRVVFNIRGNTYRLVVHVRYDIGIVFIRFIGTHVQHDRIDAETI